MSSSTLPAASELDHLVVMAPSLDEGIRWCQRTLGLAPGPGGSHPLMGTHNRLLQVSSSAFARAYLEIIAIDPQAIPKRAPGLRRWFDFDDHALAQSLRQNGPRLTHWVARTERLNAVRQAWHALGFDRGGVLAASRETPQGVLQWQITVRDDGQRLLDGTLPTLIQWGQVHPTDHMEKSPVQLQALRLQHPESHRLQQALEHAGLRVPDGISVNPGPPRITAVMNTPGGVVEICG